METTRLRQLYIHVTGDFNVLPGIPFEYVKQMVYGTAKVLFVVRIYIYIYIAMPLV